MSLRDNTLILSPDSSVADILRTGQASAYDARCNEISGFNGDEPNFDSKFLSGRPLQNRRNSKASRSQELLDNNSEIVNNVDALSQLQSDDHAGQQTTGVTGLTEQI